MNAAESQRYTALVDYNHELTRAINMAAEDASEMADAADAVICTIFGDRDHSHEDAIYGLTEAEQLAAIRLAAGDLTTLLRGEDK